MSLKSELCVQSKPCILSAIWTRDNMRKMGALGPAGAETAAPELTLGAGVVTRLIRCPSLRRLTSHRLTGQRVSLSQASFC